MPSAFETDFAAVPWTLLSGVHGVSVTYTPATGSPGIKTAIWQPAEDPPELVGDWRAGVRRGTVTMLPSDAPAADERDKFTIDSTTYYVTRVRDRTPVVVFEVEAEVTR